METDAPSYRLVKRTLDRSLAIVLLVVLSPLFVIATVAVLLGMALRPGDRGGVLYREPRLSAGRTFALLKFRTLRRDVLARQSAGEAHARLLEADPANLTWAGRRVLKPWYLDELPQLVNILRGDLSLVGPRPWPASLVDRQVAEGYDYRLRTIAGWTGPVQVQKGVVDPTTYTELDLAYVEACRSWSSARLLRYDLGILWQTVKVLARGEGLRY